MPGRRRPRMRPAAGQRLLQQRMGDLFGAVCLSSHAAYVRRPASDVHGRSEPSRDVCSRRASACPRQPAGSWGSQACRCPLPREGGRALVAPFAMTIRCGDSLCGDCVLALPMACSTRSPPARAGVIVSERPGIVTTGAENPGQGACGLAGTAARR